MFSPERKMKLAHSLAKDPVPVSEVVYETVSEVRGDMIVLNCFHTGAGKADYDLLNQTNLIYDQNHLTDTNKAIDAMEVIFALRDKYHALRFGQVVA